MSDDATQPDRNPENPKEGIDLRPDGGVHLWLDGTKHRLRRPRGREFRKLREELQDHLDAINGQADENYEWIQTMQVRGDEREQRGEARMTAEERAEDRRRGRAIRDITEDLLRGWWCSVIATLAVEERDIDAEDLPIWLVGADQALSVLDHWRSVPSLSGAP